MVGVGCLLDDPQRCELAFEQLLPHESPELVVGLAVVGVRGREETPQARVVRLHDLAQLRGQRAEQLALLGREPQAIAALAIPLDPASRHISPA